MERFVPIQIETCLVEPINKTLQNTKFYNVVVDNCPPYVPVPERGPRRWIRQWPIMRYMDETVEWPPHPRDASGHLLGAVVLIQSTDNRFLLLRNNGLWGLPKGTRNYVEFTDLLKNRKDNTFRFEGKIVLRTVETPEANAVRETLEETGIVVDPGQLIPINERNNHAYVRFLYRWGRDSATYGETLQRMRGYMDHENDEIGWFTTAELRHLLSQHCVSKRTRKINYVSFTFLQKFVASMPVCGESQGT